MKSTITCKIIAIIFIFSIPSYLNSQTDPDHPNILLIIADDLGIDAINGYQNSARLPSTPTLDSLRSVGITFENAWAAPQCTPTRAALMSGKFGIKTGVLRPPGNLDTIHESIFAKLEETTNNAYSDAVIGKWHISNPVNFNHPSEHHIDYFEGFMTGEVDDYFNWEKVINNEAVQIEEYVTTNLTDASINWVNQQNQPWFLWLGHAAPHVPFHIPPDGLYSTTNTDDNLGKYIAAIEAIDLEMNRLFKTIPAAQLENTIVIFVGDNGTPTRVLQNYPAGQGKGSLNEGGVLVPLIIAGQGVARKGEREEAMIHVADIYATLLEITGSELKGGIYNSKSFKSLLSCGERVFKKYNYTDTQAGNDQGYAIRDEQYKLIKFESGTESFYDLLNDPLETTDLIDNLSQELMDLKSEFEMEANQIRTDWSCNDGILNGTEVNIDDCGEDCSNNNSMSTTNIGCCDTPSSPSIYYEEAATDQRRIFTNNYPGHSFCYNPNQIPSPILQLYDIARKPEIADQISPVVRDNGRPLRFFGVARNGVKFAPAPALPFVFENPNTGEYNWDWVFEPTTNQGDGMGLVALDCASAHTGPQGYHYHGNMFEYVEQVVPGISATNTPPSRPLHIGYSSDGFPILYRFGPDENNVMKELHPSYTIRTGLRDGDGITAPCGAYNGKYIADYEYTCGQGDLDECNGVERTIILQTDIGLDTFNYFYVITSTFPQISRCMVGEPSEDFENSSPVYTGADSDNDGYPNEFDCAPNNADINPGATEIPGNGIDENCDGLDELSMVDEDGDGFYAENDCEDTNENIYPGATEICNGLDDNCDGEIDEGFSLTTYYQDSDMDGFGNDDAPISGCVQPPSTSTVGGDCNDNDNTIFPGADENCNGLDDNCDDEIDEGLNVSTYFIDADGDGFGNDTMTIVDCMQPNGSTTVGGDCDDNNFDINPDAEEIPNNGIDEDCNGEDLSTSTFNLNGISVKIYPNPVSHNLVIETEINSGQLEIQILNNYGQLVHQSNTKIIDMTIFNNGIYFLRVFEKSTGKSLIHKILKVQ